MRYGSVCSGIEAASVAWEPLGWKPAFFSEIEPFPRAVLAHQWPGTKCHGDFTTIQAGDYAPIDLLVGGTPCQSFSVAGLRGGLADERGNLALEFLRLAERLRPRWLVWENVPGVLSSGGGRDFGSFLGGLVQLGYGFSYRVLDAQFYGLAQRRKRLFVVGYLGDWRRAWAVLSQPASLRWDTPPRREAGEGATGTLEASLGRSRGAGTPTSAIQAVANTLGAKKDGGWRDDLDNDTYAVVPLQAGAQHGIAVALRGREGGGVAELGDECAHALRASQGGGDKPHVLAFNHKASAHQSMNPGAVSPSLEVGKSDGVCVSAGPSAVRRLTPRECERLQGFPDEYTRIPYGKKGVGSGWSADGPRYRALGNSMAVPVMAWIGQRIAAQEAEIQAHRQQTAA